MPRKKKTKWEKRIELLAALPAQLLEDIIEYIQRIIEGR